MALQPLSRQKAIIVIANALVGAVALIVVGFVGSANEAVTDWLADFNIPLGVALGISTVFVLMWLAIGFWSLSQGSKHRVV